MKQLLILISVFILPIITRACDICGCGAGNNYIGILPDFQRHIIGIRYRYNSLQSHIGAGGTATYLTTQEQYHTLEAWTGWNIGKRFRVMATIPFNYDTRTNQGLTQNKNGLGDISALGYFQLINKRHTVNSSLLIQSLWLGLGLKLPTGTYTPTDKSATGEFANLFQLGTGSTDFFLSGMYDMRLQDFGVNINAVYKTNTANNQDYRYGNKVSCNLQLYQKFRTKRGWGIAPNAGITFESSARDLDAGRSVDASGGRLLSGTGGLEISRGKLSFGLNYQVPVSQNLASGIVKAGERLMIHFAVSL